MAKTAVVNPRKKRSRRRRRNPSPPAQANPRRRRRRNSHRSYGAARRAPARRHHRRRRNPISPYASGGYRRSPNPFGLSSVSGAFSEIMTIVPAGTIGITAARFGVKASGEWSKDGKGVLEPGFSQALAIFLAAHVGGALVSTLFRNPAQGNIAKIAALSYGGDLFARMRFFKDSDFYKNNFSLAGLGEDEEYEDAGLVDGFQDTSVLGEEFEDSSGDAYRSGDRGWALAGMGLDSPPGSGARLAGMGSPQLMVGNDGTVYQLSGFQNSSALGAHPARANMSSSFGYTP